MKSDQTSTSLKGTVEQNARHFGICDIKTLLKDRFVTCGSCFKRKRESQEYSELCELSYLNHYWRNDL